MSPVTAAAVSSAAHPSAHRFHALGVKRVVRETPDAVSIVFEIPPAVADVFAYRAGQFVSVRVVVGGEQHVRSYSMSSAPVVDPDLQVTVKRVPGGVVSNWLNDNMTEGAALDVSPPAGRFVLSDTHRDLVALAAGSGITPVLSIVKTALWTTQRRVRLLYANRDAESTIFAEALGVLAAGHPRRLSVEHHLDVERGFVDADRVTTFAGEAGGEFYVCGPTPFMEVVQGALRAAGVDDGRVHVEWFTPPSQEPASTPVEVDSDAIELTIELAGQTATLAHRPGLTILESARWAGLPAPSSCEMGNCGTCIGRIIEGRAAMRINDVLTADEVAEGWVLTCQAVPQSPVVNVVYE